MPYPVIPDIPGQNMAPYPSGATPLVESSGDVAAATATATLPAAANKYTYITGFEITGSGATAASVIQATITDGTWTETFDLAVVAGVTLQNAPLMRTFSPPLKASAPNTAITVSCPSLGSGNAHNCVNAEGYQL